MRTANGRPPLGALGANTPPDREAGKAAPAAASADGEYPMSLHHGQATTPAGVDGDLQHLAASMSRQALAENRAAESDGEN